METKIKNAIPFDFKLLKRKLNTYVWNEQNMSGAVWWKLWSADGDSTGETYHVHVWEDSI